MTWIIAVCGTMGSGKSTLIDNAVAALPECESLHEDDHNRTTERSLADIDDWWNRGADVAEFDLSGLIMQLSKKAPDRSPERNSTPVGFRNQKLLLLETHFGRLHPLLQPWIDCQFWIDVPADIAVARKIAQLSAQLRTQSSTESDSSGLKWIHEFCSGYLSTTRKLFEMQRQHVGKLSDVSIDGQGTPLDVCAGFLHSLPQKYRPE